MLRDVRRATRARERLWLSRRRHSCSRPPRARHCASPRITDILRRRTRSPTPLCVGVAFAVRLRTPLTATTVRSMRAWESYQGPREVTGARAHRSPLLPLAVLSYGWSTCPFFRKPCFLIFTTQSPAYSPSSPAVACSVRRQLSLHVGRREPRYESERAALHGHRVIAAPPLVFETTREVTGAHAHRSPILSHAVLAYGWSTCPFSSEVINFLMFVPTQSPAYSPSSPGSPPAHHQAFKNRDSPRFRALLFTFFFHIAYSPTSPACGARRIGRHTTHRFAWRLRLSLRWFERTRRTFRALLCLPAQYL